MLNTTRVLLAALILSITGCGSSETTTADAATDGATDVTPVATADATPDTSTDVAADATADSSTDVVADAKPEAGLHPACASCGADELCVVNFDGTCLAFSVRCAKKTAQCQAAVCNQACNVLCGPADGGPSQLTCQGPACPTSGQYPNAVLCYGP